jgi:ferredoxin--NADP+ reductase
MQGIDDRTVPSAIAASSENRRVCKTGNIYQVPGSSAQERVQHGREQSAGSLFLSCRKTYSRLTGFGVKKITYSKVLEIKNLTESTYVLRLEKGNFEFKAGQYLVLNVPGKYKAREYSVYSPEAAPYIDLLIKEVIDGEISKELKYLKVGTKVEITGPFGFFILRDSKNNKINHFTFVATGTGISPFHSIILSNPGLDYEVIHGVKYSYEAYDSKDYSKGRYTLCTSRGKGGNFSGRVNRYFSEKGVRKDSVYYICGNSGMVNELSEYLEKMGISPENIRTEVFF